MNFKNELLHHAEYTQSTTTGRMVTTDELIQQTTAATFGWMGVLLLIAFGSAYAFASGLFPVVPITQTSMLIAFIVGLGIIRYAGSKWQSLSYGALVSCMIAFALIEGYTLSIIFFAYEIGNILSVFLTTGLVFMILAVVGKFTSINIAKTGTFLMRALIGYIIAMLANSFFFQSSSGDLILSGIGLMIFAGFVIYDMNLIKAMAPLQDKKVPVLLSLGLFINFINIFLILLRLLGRE